MKEIKWKVLEGKKLEGVIFLIPTDTIYGFSCLSFDRVATEKIEKLKNRNSGKYFINLISSINDIKYFDVDISEKHKIVLEKIWPGKVTVILKNSTGKKVSFRLPEKKELRKFIEKVGPIISTSANISGEKNIKKVSDLSECMKKQIDFFIDEGCLNGQESIVLDILR